MKKFIAVVIAGLFTLTAGANAASAEALKVGLVELQKAVFESDAGKRARADFDSLVKSKQASIEEKGKSIEKLRADMEKQAAVISPDAKKAKIEEIERLERDFQRLVADSQAEIKKKEGELLGEIYKELRDVISKIGQEDGLSLILEYNEGGVLYSNKSLDITDRVIKRYNEAKASKK